jgi:hypothetical protein
MRAGAQLGSAQFEHGVTIMANKTRQGYARKRILKLAGYSFLAGAT